MKTHRTSLNLDELREYFASSTNRHTSMNCADNTEPPFSTAFNRGATGVVLAREAGMPFQPPFDRPIQGTQWRL